MSYSPSSFDEIVQKAIENRPRSGFDWYGKVEINHRRVEFDLIFCGPVAVLEFKKKPEWENLQLSAAHTDATVEDKGNGLALIIRQFPYARERFGKLDIRLAETFMNTGYRKNLIDGLSEPRPERYKMGPRSWTARLGQENGLCDGRRSLGTSNFAVCSVRI